MGSYPWRLMLLYTAFLCLVLQWLFFPRSIGWLISGSVLTFIVSGYACWYQLKREKRIRQVAADWDSLNERLASFPRRLLYRLPVMFVTGNATADFFSQQQDKQVAITEKGIWIAAPNPASIAVMIDALSERWFAPAGNIGVILTLVPERFERNGLLKGYLQTFRQSWADVCRACGYTLPGYLVIGAHLGEQSQTLPWFCWHTGSAEMRLLDDEETPLTAWRHQSVNKQNGERYDVTVMLSTLHQWVDQQVLPVLRDTKQPVSPWIPGAVAYLNVNLTKQQRNVWQRYLHAITALSLPTASHVETVIRLPEKLVDWMPRRSIMSNRTRAGLHVVLITALFMAIALCFSAWHNGRLLQRISLDLHHYDAVSASHNHDVLQALQILQRHKTVLDNYAREGEPQRLGLGLYQGNALITPLNNAIRRYQPPQPLPPREVIDIPKVIRLDSTTLFDSGQSQIRADATRALINALVELKAQPGGLIVIAGHSDITGSPARNQALSYARAEAVRDWLITASNLEKTCFAIQGYGAARPIADNRTAEGRAANRRVEISLVPNTEACQPR